MFTRFPSGIAVLVIGFSFIGTVAFASTVLVPDEAQTVQTAIDSGADTVLIREGEYSERPVVDHCLVIQGLEPDARPRLSGMLIYNANFWTTPRLLSVSGVAFRGAIRYETVSFAPRLLTLSFSRCDLDSGIQIVNEDAEDIFELAIRNCRMRGGSEGAIDVLSMDADTVDGGVAWRVSLASIQDCWFRGGTGRAIELTGHPRSGSTARNRIEQYDTAVFMEYGEGHILEGNTVQHCGTAFKLRVSSDMMIRGNEIRQCIAGMDATRCDALSVRGNLIVGMSGLGVLLSDLQDVRGPIVENNVIGNCEGHGLIVDSSDETVVNGNSIFANAGSGIVLARNYGVPMRGIVVENNISYGNRAWGLWAGPGEIVTLGCNDWFGNELGSVYGTESARDLGVDPMFCDVDSGDVRIDSSSLLVDSPGCGQIGALGVGCGVTATLVRRFAGERVSDGVKVMWEVADGATASEIWLERSESPERSGWTRPLTERSFEDRVVVELDRSAVAGGAYWYRLVAREGSEAMVIGAPIFVQAGLSPGFRLVEVGPNPGAVPVRITFAVKDAATIAIDVYDVEGRRVASPVRGPWPAGTHTVEWNGRMHQGEAASAGLYFLVYRFPGGQDRRTVIRAR